MRHATKTLCRSCGAPTLTGMSDDIGAHHVVVDATPLSLIGEALAQLDGRLTYALRRMGRHKDLHRRDRWQIAGSPAGDRRVGGATDIVAEHRCHSVDLPDLPSALVRPIRESRHDRPAF